MTYWMERNLGWQYLYSPGFRKLRYIIDSDTDIVHIHSLWGASGYADVGGLPALSRRFPAVMTLREQWLTTGHCACPFECERWQTGCGRCPDLSLAPAIPRDGTRFNWTRKFIALRRSRMRVTTISDWLRQKVERSPIFAGKKISVVYNSIDEATFTPGSRQEARTALGLPPDCFIVLLAGQSIEGIRQGIAQHAISALNQLAQERPFALLVGRSAGAVAETLAVPSKVLPFQQNPEDMTVCYRAADITVVTSEYETFGRIAAESQACGTPVVAFQTGGLPEVVQHGEGGLTVKKGDVGELMAAVRFCMDHPDEVERMGAEGPQWVRRNFAMDKVALDYVSLYRETIAERANRKA
jgi:glycosyltransferase involved in cell wall biosynthesis